MTATATTPRPLRRRRSHPSASSAAASAFRALLLRDLTVLRKNLKEFIPRTLLQPLLLVFVFTYVFPKIGQGIGGGSGGAAGSSPRCSTAGVIAVGHPVPGHPGRGAAARAGVRLHEGDRGPGARPAADRAGGRSRRSWPARCSACSPPLSCSRSPRSCRPRPCTCTINWLVLLTLGPLACVMAAALGLTFGTLFEPRTVPLLFGVIIVPAHVPRLRLLLVVGAAPIRWLQIAVLLNPLVYISEGFRAALTNSPT